MLPMVLRAVVLAVAAQVASSVGASAEIRSGILFLTICHVLFDLLVKFGTSKTERIFLEETDLMHEKLPMD